LACAGRLAGLALAAALAGAALPAAAQEVPRVPFLFINQERLLTGSEAGQALLAEEDRQRDALRSEARALDSAFEAEERRLTDQRPTMDPEEFRKLADDFDARVVQARRDQDNRATQLAQEFDQRRRQFYALVAPLLVDLMDRAGARAVFDENSALLTDQTLNITDEVIAAIDAQGVTVPETPPAGDQTAPPAGATQPPAETPPPPVDAPEAPPAPAAPAVRTAPEGTFVPVPGDIRPARRPEGGN
jgi:Skp family chaperone for outer membrane proteins